MKQRTRIQCIKARIYWHYSYFIRVRQAWTRVHQTGRSLSQAMREAYAKGREEMQ